MNSEQDQGKEKQDKLLRDVTAIFMTYGIKSMTMDDIARQLHISKKTLYQYVKDKNDLVSKCLGQEICGEECEMSTIAGKNLNAIDENLEISKYVIGKIQQVHPSIFFELERYYPEAWNLLQESRNGFTGEMIYNNIKKGMEEGLFREDIHVEIATRLWLSRLNAIFQPQLFPIHEFELSEVYNQMFVHQIRGLASEKGLKYLEERIEPKLKKE